MVSELFPIWKRDHWITMIKSDQNDPYQADDILVHRNDQHGIVIQIP